MNVITLFAGFPCNRGYFVQNYVICALILSFGIILALVAYRKIFNKILKYLTVASVVFIAMLNSLVWWNLAIPPQCEQSLIENFKDSNSGYR